MSFFFAHVCSIACITTTCTFGGSHGRALHIDGWCLELESRTGCLRYPCCYALCTHTTSDNLYLNEAYELLSAQLFWIPVTFGRNAAGFWVSIISVWL